MWCVLTAAGFNLALPTGTGVQDGRASGAPLLQDVRVAQRQRLTSLTRRYFAILCHSVDQNSVSFGRMQEGIQ